MPDFVDTEPERQRLLDQVRREESRRDLTWPVIFMWLGLIFPFFWLIGVILGAIRVARGGDKTVYFGNLFASIIVGMIVGFLIVVANRSAY